MVGTVKKEGGGQLLWERLPTLFAQSRFVGPAFTRFCRACVHNPKNRMAQELNRNQKPEASQPFSINRKKNRNRWNCFSGTETGTGTVPFCKTVLKQNKPFPEEPSGPKTGTARTVPCKNRSRTEPNWGHRERMSKLEKAVAVAWIVQGDRGENSAKYRGSSGKVFQNHQLLQILAFRTREEKRMRKKGGHCLSSHKTSTTCFNSSLTRGGLYECMNFAAGRINFEKRELKWPGRSRPCLQFPSHAVFRGSGRIEPLVNAHRHILTTTELKSSTMATCMSSPPSFQACPLQGRASLKGRVRERVGHVFIKVCGEPLCVYGTGSGSGSLLLGRFEKFTGKSQRWSDGSFRRIHLLHRFDFIAWSSQTPQEGNLLVY